ncbi:MAG TPA: ATP-binding protein [Gemmatimonadaceae bacterium]|nr:ATP-binding protein [Gemmatimonadaceae bacterium]
MTKVPDPASARDRISRHANNDRHERENSSLYRALVESVKDYAIFALDSTGHILTWNEGAQRLKNYTADEIIGKHFSIFYPPEDVAAHKPQRELEIAARDGRVEDEGWRVRKDGSRFWANVVITALVDESGKLYGFAKVTRDLTHRVQAEEQARALAAETAARAATEARNRELEQLTDKLRDQAKELEAEREEAQSLAEELEETNQQLQEVVIEAEAARDQADEAQEFTRGILESISDPFVVQDAEWRFQYVNEAAAKLFSRSHPSDTHALIGKVVWDLYPELRGTDFEREMRRAVQEQKPVTFEAFYPPRGEWSMMFCYPLAGGGLATQWKDITARKQAEEAAHYLTRATEVLSSSLDYTSTLNELAKLVVPRLADWSAVEIVNEQGVSEQIAVAHVDPAKVRWARELNERYPPDRNAPSGAPNVLRTGKPELWSEIPRDLLEAGAQDAEHLRIIRELNLHSAMVVPLIARDRTLGVMTLISAESGRRYTQMDLNLAMELARRAALAVDNARLHRAAVEAQHTAEQANLAKTEFLTTMSHELRTPLNAIAGYAELLRMGIQGPLTPSQDEYMQRIQRSQHHLLSLINDVLNFAKLEAGRVEYEYETVDVRDVLAEMEALVLPQIKQAQLAFEYRPCSDAVDVRADVEKMRQIILNLLSNAIKFTPAGGSIGVECGARDDVGYVVVRDTGPGIPPEKIDAIFQPFVQLGRSTTERQAGTGLGLAISRDLARAMRGDLTVASTVGQGAAFTLELPLERASRQ